VPQDSDFRNGKMIAAAFEPASAWRHPPVLHFWPEGPSDIACDLFASELVRAIGRRPVFDLSLLGIGADGHTAGLFSLDDTRKPSGLIAFPTIAPAEPSQRMTLSAETLKNSRSLLILAKGGKKGTVLDDLRNGVVYPISLVAGKQGIFYYLEQ
jgi:6-phosphogluconolactonase